ncbi:MAG TPA: SufS family cysteine desulfurase, partial [Planctomycetaceae bacterium]|jgi:cysteine desulfurase/selenocysteine lyase|nr:SufS family cysteine desulfurase [Planctomycetaceae bacterium]
MVAPTETLPTVDHGHPFDPAAIRSQFPIFDRPLPNGKPLVYLDSAATAQKPHSVIEKERECYERYYANAYRGDYQFGVQIDEELEATRAKVRNFIGASQSEEIIFTSGTTMSINLVADAWGRKFLKPGDEILLTQMEHHANIVPWQQVAHATGAVLKYIPLTSDWQLDLNRLDDLLTERTKMVAVSGMSNVLGTAPPIREIAAAAHKRGALLLVDGAQSVPHLATNVGEQGIDFLAFSAHKLYGPSGVGVLWGRRSLLEAMDPFLGGGHMISEVFWDHSNWAAIPAKFEAGTLPIAQAVALGTAVDFVTSLGMPAIAAHDLDLTVYAHQRLSTIPGLRIFGPEPTQKGPIVSFAIEGLHPQDLANLVDRKGVAVRHGHHCTMPLHSLFGVPATTRASFGVYTTRDDIDVLVEAIEFARQKVRRT